MDHNFNYDGTKSRLTRCDKTKTKESKTGSSIASNDNNKKNVKLKKKKTDPTISHELRYLISMFKYR